MRILSVALLGVLTFAAAATAQQSPPKSPPPGTPEQLAATLAQWEREMAAVKSLSAECKRTDVNRVRNDQVVLTGVVKCLKVESAGKVDKLALLQLDRKDDPERSEKYICTGAVLYRFAPAQKTIFVHKLRGGADDSFLDNFFQLKAESMRKRYDMTLVMPDDPNYIYFDLKPKMEADKAEFQRARLVLYKKNYLPAQLWFEEPNGNHHTWELTHVTANDPAVKPAEFVAPEKPKGWEIKEVKETDADTPPRVIRPSNARP
jgi:TIGR03009 family protein